jgi:hypothetical protein
MLTLDTHCGDLMFNFRAKWADQQLHGWNGGGKPSAPSELPTPRQAGYAASKIVGVPYQGLSAGYGCIAVQQSEHSTKFALKLGDNAARFEELERVGDEMRASCASASADQGEGGNDDENSASSSVFGDDGEQDPME